MKRLLTLALAAATLAAPLAAATQASAFDGERGRGRWEQRGDQRGDRGPASGSQGMRRWATDDGPNRGRGQERPRMQQRRGDDREDGRNYYGPPPGEGATPRAYGLRRGGYLPPEANGPSVEDYGRYRLRPPPRGFRWVRAGGGYALVGPDGQIFDMIR